MRLKIISCEIFLREVCAIVARSPNFVDMEFLPKGLHDIGSSGMLARIQEALNRVDESKYDAVVLGYGLCNNGVTGLAARLIPLVLPRAHDCITLFFGNKERYLDYFNQNPGVYFQTTGWIERGEDKSALRQLSIQNRSGMDRSYEELVQKYGEDNAQYLWEQLCNCVKNYGQITFIEMGIEPDDRFERRAIEQAAVRGWRFDKVRGDISLMQRMVDGIWDESEFLIVRPGERIAATYDENILCVEPA